MTTEQEKQVAAPVQQATSQAAPPGFNLGELFADPERSEKGVWVDYYNGAKLLLASTNSKSYKAELNRLARRNKLRLDTNNPVYYEAILDVTAEAIAKKVLLNWSGIHLPNEDGTVRYNVPYTPELGKWVLLRSDDFKEFVIEQAGQIDNFKKELVTEAKKP